MVLLSHNEIHTMKKMYIVDGERWTTKSRSGHI